MIVEHIARICHEANKAYCESLGDVSQVSWEMAPDWQKQSAISGVRFHMAHPESTPEMSHMEWLKQKEREGWVYGLVKDASKKEHPCMVAYNDLPVEQRMKDSLFVAIVRALS